MHKIKKHIDLFINLWMMILIVSFSGCSDEYPVQGNSGNQKIALDLSLSVPGIALLNTKAMSPDQESGINSSKIQVLMFEQTGSIEVFRYQATIASQNLPHITLEVPPGSSNQKYRLVVLANTEPQTITAGQTKEEVLQQFVFDCLGKWNASSVSPAAIPMWGETNELIVINNGRSVNILLHRALARVDVGLLFKFNNPDPADGSGYLYKDTDKESVYGMNNFKIKDVRVYRTRSKAYIASSTELMHGDEVFAPSIPAEANYNSDSGTEYTTRTEADQYPLLYTLPAGSNSYIREIYIPESALIDAQSNKDNVPCIVVGGYYGSDNTTEVTYYRADFATYNNGTVASYRPVLRNHQYVFDIKSVNNPGFKTPEQALNAINSPIELNVMEWNQVPLDSHLQGHYYLDIKEREIWMEARAQADLQENKYTVSYQTNLDLKAGTEHVFKYKWHSTDSSESPYFDIDFDYSSKTIIFTAKSDNINAGNAIRSDLVTLEVENLGLNIRVNQKAFSSDYKLSCAEVKVFGTYRENIPLNYSNYIEMKVVTKGSTLNGKTYEVKTLEKNGIYFLAEGTFDANKATALGGGDYEYTVRLEGFNTPVKESESKKLESFDVTIISNSINNDYCAASIIMSYKEKRILTIGANAVYRFGYMLEPNTASRAFIDASTNFGTAANSAVSMEENNQGNAFTIEVMTAGQGMIGERIDYSYLKNKLNTFKPDIILTGQAVNYNDASGGDAIQLLSDFVDAGGVFLMCNEYYPVSGSIEAMVQKIMGSGVSGNNQSIGTNQTFILSGPSGDPVTNGPFGNMQGKLWGADGHEMHGFTNLPAAITVSYSNRSDGYTNMFRHTKKGFFFMGEGGFISNPQRYIGGAYQGSYVYCPFAIDSNYRPIPRTNYTTNRNTSVYNSQLFGNIIAWAVHYAESQGIKYPQTGNKFP